MTTVHPTPRVVAAPRRMPGPQGASSAVREPRSAARRAFTLVELLVVVSIILVLMGLMASAVSAARGSQKKQATQALIAKLDVIIQQQYAKYSSQTVAGTATQAAAARRQMVTADMPDNWNEVKALKDGTTPLIGSTVRKFPLNAAQRAYAQYYASVTPSPKFEDAECLFMIVMLGGLADCLDCGGLGLSEKGDKDNDKAPEFWDAWGNPIGFVLWPAGFQLPPGSGEYFSPTAPFDSGPVMAAPGGVMRPLIYSSGADGRSCIGTSTFCQIASGTNCGNPADVNAKTNGALAGDPPDQRADNITNFDAEAKK